MLNVPTHSIRHFLALGFYVVVTWLVYRTRAYTLWSRLYRRLYNRPYTDPDSKHYSPTQATHDVHTASQAMSLIKWHRDGFRELWDAIAHPNWFEYNLGLVRKGKRQVDRSMDCDEFAVWAQASLDPSYRPLVLNVVWLTPVPARRNRYRYVPNGHHVCLVRHERTSSIVEYQHIGNWGPSRHFGKISSLIHDLVPYGSDLVRWTMLDGDLGLVATSSKAEDADWVKGVTDR